MTTAETIISIAVPAIFAGYWSEKIVNYLAATFGKGKRKSHTSEKGRTPTKENTSVKE